MIEKIKELREKTGAGMMECKNALKEAGGDTKKALEILKKKGISLAKKRSSRSTRAGIIQSYIHMDSKIGVLVEVNCETDFVARNEEFKRFVKDISMQIAAMDPSDVTSLLEQPFIKDTNIKVRDLLVSLIAKTGENISIRRFVRYQLGEELS